MNWGDFREYFRGFASKRLTAHEVDPQVSNGHEFQGVNGLKALLGTEDRDQIPARYILLADDVAEQEVLKLSASWYDARRKAANRSAEYRLYYPAAAGEVQARMKAGDLMVLCFTQQQELLILLAAAGSDRERELEVLFGLDPERLGALSVRRLDEPIGIDLVSATILEQLGIATPHGPRDGDAGVVERLVDELVRLHPDSLPKGSVVSAMVRSELRGIDPLEAPDDALYRWVEAEAAMFRSWEDRKIAIRLKQGFVDSSGAADVDGFRQFSMSLRQSRVTRAGGALQGHMRALLDIRGLRYAAEPRIDGGEIPDFLFPSVAAYENQEFPAQRLRMLAAKFTAKDRWRQVLNEAHRIRRKHLLTLEAAISANQLALMSAAKLQLVMPTAVRAHYPLTQSNGIMQVSAFLDEVEETQKS